MKAPDAIEALAALGQASRLAVYRLLKKAGTDGLASGEVARRLAMPSASFSFHIKELRRAGLVVPRRSGRFVYYRANSDRMDQVVEYLAENCCGEGSPPRAAKGEQLHSSSRRRVRSA